MGKGDNGNGKILKHKEQRKKQKKTNGKILKSNEEQKQNKRKIIKTIEKTNSKILKEK